MMQQAPHNPFYQLQQLGFVLVPLMPGTKKPAAGKGWNRPENCVYPATPALGASFGIAHAYSGTVALDIDMVQETREIFAQHNIDLDQLLASGIQIRSGKDNHGKLLYRMPPNTIWPTRAHKLGKHDVFQFRCATREGLTVQDVLPPSVHPDTGQVYTWQGVGEIPYLPQALLDLWYSMQVTHTQRKKMGDAVNVSQHDVESALATLDPDVDRDKWVRIGMALHEADSSLVWLFDEWSAGGTKYVGSHDVDAVWSSFDEGRDGNVTASTLFYEARSAGWREQTFDVIPFAQPTPAQPAGVPQALRKKRLNSVCLADVRPVPIDWMWEGFLVDRKLNLIAGNPGVSKSVLLAEFAANVSRGGTWPDGKPIKQGVAVLLSAEDEDADTVVPRLIAAGADMNYVHSVKSVVDPEADFAVRVFQLEQDIVVLRELIMEIGNVRMVSLDPLNSYLGPDINANSDAEVRAVLIPLIELAEELGFCLIGNAHLNKAATTSAIYRVMGSMAFAAIARIVWGVVIDKDDPDRRLITNIKANITKNTEGLAYRVDSKPFTFDNGKVQPIPYLTFEEERHDITADEAMTTTLGETGRPPSRRDEVADFIEDYLAAGPVKSSDLMEACDAEGFAVATVKRARGKMDLNVRNRSNVWWVALPKDAVHMQDTEENAVPAGDVLPSFLL